MEIYKASWVQVPKLERPQIMAFDLGVFGDHMLKLYAT